MHGLSAASCLPSLSPEHGDGSGDPNADNGLLDDLCRLARLVFRCPTALVTVVTAPEDGEGEPRLDGPDARFAEEVLVTEAPLVVADTREDARFADDLLVTAYPFVRFYAGAPVVLPAGPVAGVFSLMDYRTRSPFGSEELALLRTVARLAGGEMARRIAERTRRQDAAQFERLVPAAPTPVLEIDAGGRIIRANRAVEILTGIDAAALRQVPATRVLVNAHDVISACRKVLCPAGGPRMHPARPVDLVTHDGVMIPHLAHVSSWYEDGAMRLRLVLERRT